MCCLVCGLEEESMYDDLLSDDVGVMACVGLERAVVGPEID